MDFGLLILLALAIPVCAIAGFVMALGLRRRADALERRLARLEARLGPAEPAPSAVSSPLPAAPLVPEPISTEPAVEAAPFSPKGPAEGGPSPVQPPPAPPSAKLGFEETLGTRWTVWVGGVALALGGVFLVRYSIEQGLLGPGARVAAGAFFALMLIGAGEWLRRRETAPALSGFSSAHVPGVLTAAGTSTAFATAFAAYALYGLIGPGVAFVLLGVIAVLTMIAAALHGPALAALGLVAALGSPLLVQSQRPQPWAIVVYLFRGARGLRRCPLAAVEMARAGRRRRRDDLDGSARVEQRTGCPADDGARGDPGRSRRGVSDRRSLSGRPGRRGASGPFRRRRVLRLRFAGNLRDGVRS